MHLRKMLIVTPLLILAFACGGTTANVKYGSASLLAERRIVAVVDVNVSQSQSDSFMNAMMFQVNQAVEGISGSQSPRENAEERFQEYLVNTINRNLLGKGFAPIQRRKIQQVLREQAFQQSGLTEDPTEIGRLLDARAVFTGKLSILKKDGFDYPIALACLMPVLLVIPRPEANIAFSGELTDVETGSVLASGTSSKTVRDVKAKDVDDVIEGWFDELPGF